MHIGLQLRVAGQVDPKSRRSGLVLELQLELRRSPIRVGSQTTRRTRSGGYDTPGVGLGQSLVRRTQVAGRASRFCWWAWAVAQCYHVGDGSYI